MYQYQLSPIDQIIFVIKKKSLLKMLILKALTSSSIDVYGYWLGELAWLTGKVNEKYMIIIIIMIDDITYVDLHKKSVLWFVIMIVQKS